MRDKPNSNVEGRLAAGGGGLVEATEVVHLGTMRRSGRVRRDPSDDSERGCGCEGL